MISAHRTGVLAGGGGTDHARRQLRLVGGGAAVAADDSHHRLAQLRRQLGRREGGSRGSRGSAPTIPRLGLPTFTKNNSEHVVNWS